MGREELRRALDGILDLERLLSRVTLETANPRDVLALAASLAKIAGGARARWGTFAADRLRTLCTPPSMNSVICASGSTTQLFPSLRFH